MNTKKLNKYKYNWAFGVNSKYFNFKSSAQMSKFLSTSKLLLFKFETQVQVQVQVQ